MCSPHTLEIIHNANSGTRWDDQRRSYPPFASWTKYFNFDAFLSPVDALACRSARATDIKVPDIHLRWIGIRTMVKDLDVIKFDSFTKNVLPGALELQQTGVFRINH